MNAATFHTIALTMPKAGLLETPLADEIGLLLVIASAGLLLGFLLRRVLGGVRLLSVLLLALLLLAWASGIGINSATIPASVDLLGLFRPLIDAWNQNVGWTPFRAGIGAVGFVVGLCLDLRERRSA